MENPYVEDRVIDTLNAISRGEPHTSSLGRVEGVAYPDHWRLGTLEHLRLQYDEAVDMYAVADDNDIPFTGEAVDELVGYCLRTTLARASADPQPLIQEFGVLMGDTAVAEHPGKPDQ